jgi:hypothetical protein
MHEEMYVPTIVRALNLKLETSVRPIIDWDLNKIEIETQTELNGQLTGHYKEVINLQDDATRRSLIQLGWTPPPS